MASRYFKQFVLTPTNRQVMLSGVVKLSAAAAVDSATIPYASVTKTDTGEYTITLDDKYVELRSAQLTMQTSEDVQARLASNDVSSAKTLVVETATAGSAADVTAAAEIHVTLILKDSSVGV
jgi:hypothetical protein